MTFAETAKAVHVIDVRTEVEDRYAEIALADDFAAPQSRVAALASRPGAVYAVRFAVSVLTDGEVCAVLPADLLLRCAAGE